MKHTLTIAALAAALAAPLAAAQESGEGRPPGARPERPPRPAVLIELFDHDGDGALSSEELGRARRLMQELRRELGDLLLQRDGARGPAAMGGPMGGGPRQFGAFGARGPGARGPGEPTGPAGMGPRGQRGLRRGEPMRLFREFDADGDGLLNPEEFARAMAASAGRGPGGPPDGPRLGPGGPPDGTPPGRPGGRGEFGRRGGRPGPPDADRGPAVQGDEGPEAGTDEEPPADPPRRRIRPRDGRGRRPPAEDAATALPEAPPFEASGEGDGV